MRIRASAQVPSAARWRCRPRRRSRCCGPRSNRASRPAGSAARRGWRGRRRRSAPGSTASNSSPPRRPIWPLSPITLVSRWATCFSSASPIGWPSVSLTFLKRSRSIRNRAQPPAAPLLVLQRLVERAAHQHPVGQAGQRIIFGEAVDLVLGAALLGQIGADAAEAEEAAMLVEARRARQRPPDFGAGVGAHGDVGEGQAGGEVEAQRALRDSAAPSSAPIRSEKGRPIRSLGADLEDGRRDARRRRRARRARSSPRTSRGRPARTPR